MPTKRPLNTPSSAPAGQRKRPLRLTLLPAILGAAIAAHAQEAPAPSVTVQGQLSSYDPRRDDTTMKFVVRRDDIERYGDTQLLDVLRRIPGVTVSGSAGRGAEIRMQGMGSGYTQVLINGERLPAGMAVETLSPATIERIEVLRGSQAEYSAESIAGTINIVLRKTSRKPERELKLGYGRGRDTRNPDASLRLADRDGQLSYSLSGSLSYDDLRGIVRAREEELDAAGRTRLLRTTDGREDGRFSTLNLVPQLEWKRENGDTLGFEGFVNLNRYYIDATAPTTTLLGPLPPYPGKRIRMGNERDIVRGELHWVHGMASGAKLDTKLGVSASSNDNRNNQDAGGNPQFAVLARRIASRGHDRGLNSIGKLTVPLFEGHDLALGWDGRYDRRKDERFEHDELDPTPVPGGEARYAGHVARLAVYAQDEWKVTPRWSVYAGGRWEGVRIRTRGSDFGAARSGSSVFSPVLQTVWKLPGAKEDQLRLAVARTYKAPSLDLLLPHRYTSVNNNQADVDTAGNPHLKPEIALGIDAAWEHHWDKGALLSVSASTRRIDDYIRSQVTFDGSRWVALPVNVGGARSHSLQLETSFPLPSLIPAAAAIDVRANVARNWSRVDAVPGPDNRLDEQVPLSAGLGLDYQRERFSAGTNFNLVRGARIAVSGNEAVWLHVRRDLEVYVLWKLAAQRKLRVAANNLLGADMVNERSYTNTANGTVLRNRLTMVGHPSLKLSLESSF
jgi:outer membrane receptor protein involved in Fe transport